MTARSPGDGESAAGTITLDACLRAGARRMAAARGSDMGEAMMEARLIAAHVTGLDAAGLMMNGADPVGEDVAAALQESFDRRARGEPVAYLTGERGFWEHRFLCRPGALIPRPDTEILVEWALELIPRSAPGYRVLDMGTGTGAIALSLSSARPDIDVFAVDRSPLALELARENVTFLRSQGARPDVAMWRGDWLSAVRPGSIDLLVGNPPYLAADDPHLSQGDLRFEPHEALVADEAGLGDYRRLLRSAYEVLRPGGVVLFEHGADQAEAVAVLMRDIGLEVIGTRRDLGGNPRVTAAGTARRRG
ncbi:peptide chain release factor N(5)-glutamine methyltransferase [Guyparkeria sp.]|uniref:peptide chain release factor N(5)-glutamine methyltransferase n=1 Tax=Guyparkeria sp. TaxID=2035736 RepID=UPI0039710638